MQFGSGSKTLKKKIFYWIGTKSAPHVTFSFLGRKTKTTRLSPAFFSSTKSGGREGAKRKWWHTIFCPHKNLSDPDMAALFASSLSSLLQGKFHNLAPGYQSTWMGKVNKGVHMDIFHFYQCYGAEILFQLILGTENFYRHWKLFTFVTLHYSFFTSYRRNFYKKLCCWDTGK